MALKNVPIQPCAFNDQKHMRARNDRFQDLYFKDHIWAAKEVWREKFKHTEMNDFLVLGGLHSEPFVF